MILSEKSFCGILWVNEYKRSDNLCIAFINEFTKEILLRKEWDMV